MGPSTAIVLFKYVSWMYSVLICFTVEINKCLIPWCALKCLIPWCALKRLIPWCALKRLIPWCALKHLIPWCALKRLIPWCSNAEKPNSSPCCACAHVKYNPGLIAGCHYLNTKSPWQHTCLLFLSSGNFLLVSLLVKYIVLPFFKYCVNKKWNFGKLHIWRYYSNPSPQLQRARPGAEKVYGMIVKRNRNIASTRFTR